MHSYTTWGCATVGTLRGTPGLCTSPPTNSHNLLTCQCGHDTTRRTGITGRRDWISKRSLRLFFPGAFFSIVSIIACSAVCAPTKRNSQPACKGLERLTGEVTKAMRRRRQSNLRTTTPDKVRRRECDTTLCGLAFVGPSRMIRPRYLHSGNRVEISSSVCNAMAEGRSEKRWCDKARGFFVSCCFNLGRPNLLRHSLPLDVRTEQNGSFCLTLKKGCH